MTVFEPRNYVEVQSPVGHGYIWLVTEYGTETDKLFGIIHDNGEYWEFPSKKLKFLNNITFGRENKFEKTK